MNSMRFEPVARVEGEYTPPADKSISHRAAIIGAMCDGPVEIENYLRSDDTLSTLSALRALGVEASENRVKGVGLRGGLKVPEGVVDVGNSGTLMRLLPGWLAAQSGQSFTLDGDESIRRRPMDRITEPLSAMGARLSATDSLPPLSIEGAALSGIAYELPVASAQVKSCLLLAGLCAQGVTTVVESEPSRDHTERILMRAGADINLSVEGGLRSISVSQSAGLLLDSIEVPNDFSSAAFFIVVAVLLYGSNLTIKNVGLNWTRTGLLRVMERMGTQIIGGIESQESASADSELIGDLEIGFGELKATEVKAVEIPLLIDELPLVALLGCFAEGETRVTGAEELRVKESDRIKAVVDGLRSLGANIEELPDGFVVQGKGELKGGMVDSHGDHRIAMMGAVAGLASKEGVEVVNMEAASVSYPGFVDDLKALTVTKQ